MNPRMRPVIVLAMSVIVGGSSCSGASGCAADHDVVGGRSPESSVRSFYLAAQRTQLASACSFVAAANSVSLARLRRAAAEVGPGHFRVRVVDKIQPDVASLIVQPSTHPKFRAVAMRFEGDGWLMIVGTPPTSESPKPSSATS